MTHVIVKCRNYPPHGVYHDPHPENEDRPKCDHPGREDIEFRTVELEAVPTYRRCKMCAGEVEYNPETGTRLSTKLSEMSLEEVGL